MDTPDFEKINKTDCVDYPQCKFFVVRKKRLCRMTVRPGRNYCGEHEPQPKTNVDQADNRIPCPYDSKHTCYSSKLLKHLAICNARQVEQPNYIVHNINISQPSIIIPRLPLSQIPQDKILALIDKVNVLYDKYVKDCISTIAEMPIHKSVLEDFNEAGRTESSLRHLRQASSLLHLMEAEGLVQDNTCYVELGAGKGQLSYYAASAWCGGSGSRVVLVDRASLRHKRDNKLRGAAGAASRVRADLAHLALHALPQAAGCHALVGFAKHLCGAATDYALRALSRDAAAGGAAAGGAARRGAALATCCHHRCERASFLAADHLQEMGVSAEDFNIMLGIVSWATCGDGRGRRAAADGAAADGAATAARAAAGRRAKALLDAARARQLRSRGWRARLVRYVPAAVSPENVCLVAARP